jgi:hypothetical protein
MGRDVTLAGLRLTADEWDALDEGARLELLCALAAPMSLDDADDDYDAYELTVEV